jgi:4,5-dihydroxyphthalate decarboxylase
MPALCIQIPDCIWTRALLETTVKVPGFEVDFAASKFDQRTSRRLRGEVEEQYDGTELVLTDYIVRIARGTETELSALPIFVTRGMVHRKLVMRRDEAPRNLRGRAVGMGRVLGATSVYGRGLLADEYGIERSEVRWVVAEPLTSDGALGGEWPHVSERGGFKASELVQRLSARELDAVIYPGGAGGHWFNWLVGGAASRTPDPYGDLEQMVAADAKLCFPVGDVDAHVAWFKKDGFYPLYHCLAIRNRVAALHSGLAGALVEAFQKAAALATRYMSPEEQKLYGREQDLLGVDPNECGLNEVNRTAVEKCVDYLEADGLLPSRPGAAEIFPLSAT